MIVTVTDIACGHYWARADVESSRGLRMCLVAIFTPRDDSWHVTGPGRRHGLSRVNIPDPRNVPILPPYRVNVRAGRVLLKDAE
jgi:hypothetical protein